MLKIQLTEKQFREQLADVVCYEWEKLLLSDVPLADLWERAKADKEINVLFHRMVFCLEACSYYDVVLEVVKNIPFAKGFSSFELETYIKKGGAFNRDLAFTIYHMFINYEKPAVYALIMLLLPPVGVVVNFNRNFIGDVVTQFDVPYLLEFEKE